MAYTISIHEEYGNVVLEVLQENNGKIKRNEVDDNKQIKEALEYLIPYIEAPKFDKQNDKMFANLPEDAKMVIHDYSLLEKYKALNKTRKRIDELIAKQEAKKSIISTTLTLGILTMAIAPQALVKMKANTEELTVPPTNIENNIEIDTTIEMKESPNEFLSGLDITLLDTKDLEFMMAPSLEDIKGEWVTTENPLANYLNIENIGKRKDDAEKLNVVTNYKDIVEKYCSLAGIDTEIMMCILAQERGFHSDKIDAGGAIGVSQIQYNQHIGNTTALKNYQTGETIQVFTITDDALQDLEQNIKIGVTIFENNLEYFNGNTLLALQAYNYGCGSVERCLNNCSERTGISKDEYINNPNLLDWIIDVKEYSESRDGYGDKDYLEHVFNHLGEDTITLQYTKDGENYTISIETEKSQTR